MHSDHDSVRMARENFGRALRSEKYTNILRDDFHLSLLMDMLTGSKYDNILDVGTGSGCMAFALADRYPKSHVCGLDTAKKIVARNAEHVGRKGVHNLTFQTYDGIRYPIENHSFDPEIF